MKRQKMITLCPRSYDEAQRKHNFSQWVRSQLLADDLTKSEATDIITFWHTIATGLMRKHGEDMGAIMQMKKQPEE